MQEVIAKGTAIFSIPVDPEIFIRVAGLSGTLAVALGAYGFHYHGDFQKKNEVNNKLKDIFDIANKYHFMNTLALLVVPMTKRPILTGSLLTSGICLFCGSIYFHALTAKATFIRNITPYGGYLLAFAWVSFFYLRHH